MFVQIRHIAPLAKIIWVLGVTPYTQIVKYSRAGNHGVTTKTRIPRVKFPGDILLKFLIARLYQVHQLIGANQIIQLRIRNHQLIITLFILDSDVYVLLTES